MVGSLDGENGNSHASVTEDSGDLQAMIALAKPDIVVLANRDENPGARLQRSRSSQRSVRVVDLPHFYEHAFGRVPISCVSPRWFLGLIHLNQRAYPRIAKRLFDIVTAILGLLV